MPIAAANLGIELARPPTGVSHIGPKPQRGTARLCHSLQ